MDFISVGNILDVGLILVGIVAAAVWLKSALVKQRHEELSNLVDTRGETIQDQALRITELETRVAKLEAAYEALQGLKASEIADEVVSRLSPKLPGT